MANFFDDPPAQEQAAPVAAAPASPTANFFDDPSPAAAPAAPTGLLSKIGQDYQNRVAQAQTIANAGEAGTKSKAAMLAEMAGTGVGGLVSDVGGDLINSAAKAILPKDGKGIAKLVSMIGQSPVGQMAGDAAGWVGQQYQKLPQNTQDALNAVGNTIKGVTTVLPVGEGTELANSAINDAGGALVKSGVDSAAANQGSFVNKLVAPNVTSKADKIDQVYNTDVNGMFQKSVPQQAPQDIQSAAAVAQVPGVSPMNTIQKNFNVIQDANQAEAQSLRDTLDKSGVTYNTADMNTKLASTMTNLSKDPLIVGDAETTAQRVVQKMQDLVDQNQPTASGLLTARQQFDQWALAKKAKVFDGNSNAFSEAVMAVRDTANDHLNSLVPHGAVSASLAKQTSLFNAMSNIAPKAAQESPTFIGRMADKVDAMLPVKSALGKIAATGTGALALGTGAVLAPSATTAALGLGATAGTLYGAGKLATAPTTRIALGKLLQGISK